jgi:hypothetical protein
MSYQLLISFVFPWQPFLHFAVGRNSIFRQRMPILDRKFQMATAPNANAPEVLIRGSCLCNWIKFTIRVPTEEEINSHPLNFTSAGKLRATNCHCNTCRQSVGALFGTWVHVPAELVTISDLAMNMGTYRSSEGATRKFCRVCGTSLFSPDDGWELEPENKEVNPTNMYNREWKGNPGKTIDISVGAMEHLEAKKWVEVVEHIYMEDTLDGGHWISLGKDLPVYI